MAAEDGKNIGLTVAAIGGVVLLLIGVAWLLAANDLAFQGVFRPAYEQVRRETFEQSKSYNQGMVQELQAMQVEYAKGDAEVKKTLAPIILHRAADYPDDKLPQDLRSFIQQLRREQTQ